jgi:hypothetical protein
MWHSKKVVRILLICIQTNTFSFFRCFMIHPLIPLVRSTSQNCKAVHSNTQLTICFSSYLHNRQYILNLNSLCCKPAFFKTFFSQPRKSKIFWTAAQRNNLQLQLSYESDNWIIVTCMNPFIYICHLAMVIIRR